MRIITLIISLFFFLTSTSASETREILDLYKTWVAAVEEGDIESYVSVLHEDVKLMPPTSEPFEGKEKYRAFLEPVFKSADYEIEVKVALRSQSTNM